MTPQELDKAYFALCGAMRELNELETTKFLARLSLLFLAEQAALDPVMRTIEDARIRHE